MSEKLDKFLGDSIWRTVIKLSIISLVVGVILSAINITPFEVWNSIREFVIHLYNLGFEALDSIFRYFIYGALIVVPIFIVMRLMQFGR